MENGFKCVKCDHTASQIRKNFARTCNKYSHTETAFVQNLADNNIKIIGMGGCKLRIVTHLDYTDVMHESLLGVLESL